MLQWKQNKQKKALLIKGMRQVGKTTIVQQFGNENYENVVYIDFKANNSAKKIFDDDIDVNRITIDLSALYPHTKFIPYKTVIIFDEIQECNNARNSLKEFVIDGRYDVIATGSLLGIKGYNKSISKGIPVGYEHTLYMKPMDFEEFLWAKGINQAVIDNMLECFNNLKKISDTTHKAMIRYFKEYICVGGMPRVVDTFINTSDMNAVLSEQHDLIKGFKDDFGKHLNKKEQEVTNFSLLTKIQTVFDSIPSQLAKENKKFVFSNLKSNGRSSEYLEAIQWLKDYGLINICYNLSMIDRPLDGYKLDNIFKLYFTDTGLFVSMLEPGSSNLILNGDMRIYKGAIFENIIAETFSKNNKPLYYYHKKSGLEIDFVSLINNLTTLIEVKSTTGKSKAAKTLFENPEKNKIDQLIKVGEYNIEQKGNTITIPYYLAFLLD